MGVGSTKPRFVGINCSSGIYISPMEYERNEVTTCGAWRDLAMEVRIGGTMGCSLSEHFPVATFRLWERGCNVEHSSPTRTGRRLWAIETGK